MATVRKVAIIGATGTLGSRIASALAAAGHEVTALQRPESNKAGPEGLRTVKVDYHNQAELIATFTGQDVVISAVPFPQLTTEKPIIDACIAAGIKRFIPSEFTTMLESPLATTLPVAREKVLIRQYLTSALPHAAGPTTWTSVNNGAFFDMALQYGVLGPNPITGKAVFHDGGDKPIAVSLLADIAAAVVRLLEDGSFEAAANQPVYICSAAVTERQLTRLVAEVLGTDFGASEEVSVKELIAESDRKLMQGDQSVVVNYYFQMMYGDGYRGGDFMEFNWNERLGLRVMGEEELKEAIRGILRE
ncbi:aromatic alcohol reductase [Aspergillus aculeatinus CBS 121060]|uniref:NAD(P)-binding protein n=1 Tax=Aspergillus aculeatinus CBS 121060 TaxID=1448322 RepID=A0ACD1HPT5_9EURO|nr:NAD(P)-binding protein [Aspergillus aculeatinus CBS 121060]RAH75388.1 NAD(P)-binding protein [Aspergillus aculeatinus CBS 121060]